MVTTNPDKRVLEEIKTMQIDHRFVLNIDNYYNGNDTTSSFLSGTITNDILEISKRCN